MQNGGIVRRCGLKQLLLGCLLILPLSGFSSQALSADATAEFPITIYPDLIYVPVTIGSTEHLCVLDSGAGTSVFHTTLREKLGALAGFTLATSADGSVSLVEQFKGPDARIGAIALKNDTPALCHDLSSMREISGRDIEGLVGVPLFRSHIVQMDFDTHHVVIGSPSTAPKSDWGESIKLSYNKGKQPTILIEFGDGITEQCTVDTGYNGYAWLSSELYTKLLDRKRIVAGEDIPVGVVGGHRTVHAGFATYMKIGSFEDHNFAVRGSGPRSRIGLDYLRQFHVTIDIPHDRIYLAKGATFGKPGEQKAVGIGLARRNGKTIVIWIQRKSPAEDAGIAINDELVTVAGEPIARRPLEEIKWMMLQEKADANGKLKLTLRRDDKDRNVELAIRDSSEAHTDKTAIPPNHPQAAIIAEIQRLGGRVTFDEDAPGKPVYAVDFSQTHIGDDDLRSVERLTELKVLTLDHTRVTDAGMKHVERLTELRTLHVYDTRLTDAGLEHTKALVHLEFLNLSETQVTDAGLKLIAGLPEVASLGLDDTRITDDGLRHLKGLKNLERLYVLHTKITPAGFKELQRSLPDLHGMGDDFDDIPR